jgi:hypothetical protein
MMILNPAALPCAAADRQLGLIAITRSMIPAR